MLVKDQNNIVCSNGRASPVHSPGFGVGVVSVVESDDDVVMGGGLGLGVADADVASSNMRVR